jgi:hypothetical protein
MECYNEEMETMKPPELTIGTDDDLFTETPIGVIRSMQAFMRDLPTLLANPKYDRWCVCYHGDERIGIGPSSAALVRECVRRNFRQDEIYIGMVTPKDPDEWIGLFLPR